MVKSLANVIIDSWDNNRKLPNGTITKKKFNSFLCDESMAAFIELTYFYDFMISCVGDRYFNDFKHDVMPILDIVRNLVIPMKTRSMFILFNKFYEGLFSLGSPILKNSNFSLFVFIFFSYTNGWCIITWAKVKFKYF
jgi:hypothetical protein